MLEIIPFDFKRHFDRVYALWKAAFDAGWPLDPKTFSRIISDAPATSGVTKQRFVAVMDDGLIGFVLFQTYKNAANGSLSLLLVAPEHQRQGLGTALHKFALKELQKAGVKRVQLGGGSPTFWQGIPDELTGAAVFFDKMGWQYSERSYDLIQDLQTFNRTEEFIDPVLAAGISFRLADPSDSAAIVSFQKAEFPNWLDSYENVLALGDFGDLLLLCHADGSLAGMVIMFSQKPIRNDWTCIGKCFWEKTPGRWVVSGLLIRFTIRGRAAP